jgi:TRAP-type mannitol/chloroaromatic compound transport system permease small subunit
MASGNDALQRTIAAADAVSETTGRWTSLLFVPMTSVLLVEVCLRYFFNAPTIWAAETAQYLFGYIFLLGGAYTLKHQGHVRVDVLINLLPERGRAVLNLLCYPIILFYLVVLFYLTAEKAWDSVVSLERTYSVWQPYLYPVLVAVPIGAALMIVHAVAMMVSDFLRLRSMSSRDRQV